MGVRGRRLAFLIIVATGALGTEIAGQAFDGPAGRFSVNGREMALHCSSGPPPTLVIDAALGDSSEDWESIARDLSTQAAVCIYDRAGYGESDPSPLPRSPTTNARDLRTLLNVAGVQPPFVIIGHSFGGLNAQAFWHQFPADVAGMILLDPTPTPSLIQGRFPGVWDLVVSEGAGLQAQAAQAKRDSTPEATRLEAMASEHREMLLWGEGAAGLDSFGDLPLLVVAAGRPNQDYLGDSAIAFQQFWIDENRSLASRSTVGRVEILESVGHAMAYEAPSVILDLIRGFLGKLST